MNEIGETNVITNNIPGDSEAYFAPISPPGSNLGGIIGTGKQEAPNKQMKRPLNLMEMLQVNNQNPGLQNANQREYTFYAIQKVWWF